MITYFWLFLALRRLYRPCRTLVLEYDRIREAKRKAEENIVNHAVDVDHDLLVAKLSKELAKLRAYELTEKLVKSKR